MTEPDPNPLTEALHRLRREVGRQVPVPAGAGLRSHARRRLRMRRTAAGLLAAGAVAAVALGGNAVLRPTAAPPVPATGDPITEVQWQEVTIDLPPHDGCPDGPVTLAAVPDTFPDGTGPAGGYPKVYLGAAHPAYGDLTGDGRAEAVVAASCARDAQDSLDGQGQLLMITQLPDGALRAVGWFGPRGAIYHGVWIADGTLYTEAHPWHGDSFDWAPGTALAYRWDGNAMVETTPADRYRPVVAIDGQGRPVRLAAVATGLACPAGTVRFGPDQIATLAGATYTLGPPGSPETGPRWPDLDRNGLPLLLLAVSCDRDGTTTTGVAVFAPHQEAYEGIAVLRLPADATGWRVTLDGYAVPHLLVEIGSGADSQQVSYQWNGSGFVAAG